MIPVRELLKSMGVPKPKDTQPDEKPSDSIEKPDSTKEPKGDLAAQLAVRAALSASLGTRSRR